MLHIFKKKKKPADVAVASLTDLTHDCVKEEIEISSVFSVPRTNKKFSVIEPTPQIPPVVYKIEVVDMKSDVEERRRIRKKTHPIIEISGNFDGNIKIFKYCEVYHDIRRNMPIFDLGDIPPVHTRGPSFSTTTFLMNWFFEKDLNGITETKNGCYLYCLEEDLHDAYEAICENLLKQFNEKEKKVFEEKKRLEIELSNLQCNKNKIRRSK